MGKFGSAMRLILTLVGEVPVSSAPLASGIEGRTCTAAFSGCTPVCERLSKGTRHEMGQPFSWHSSSRLRRAVVGGPITEALRAARLPARRPPVYAAGAGVSQQQRCVQPAAGLHSRY